MSAQNFISRFFHRRHEPEPTDWQRFREENPVQSPQRTSTVLVNPLRIKAMARMMHSPPVHFVSFNTWWRVRTGAVPQLPHPRETGTIQPAQPDNSTQSTLLPDRFRSSGLPRMSPEVRQEVFSQLRTVPSKPLEHGPTSAQEDMMPKPAPLGWVSGPIEDHAQDDAWLNDKPKGSAPLPPCIERVQYWTEAEIPAPEPKQNVWDDFAALASKSGLLPALEDDPEGDTTQGPIVKPIVETRQRRRWVEARTRYQLPDLEQKESE